MNFVKLLSDDIDAVFAIMRCYLSMAGELLYLDLLII